MLKSSRPILYLNTLYFMMIESHCHASVKQVFSRIIIDILEIILRIPSQTILIWGCQFHCILISLYKNMDHNSLRGTSTAIHSNFARTLLYSASEYLVVKVFSAGIYKVILLISYWTLILPPIGRVRKTFFQANFSLVGISIRLGARIPQKKM